MTSSMLDMPLSLSTLGLTIKLVHGIFQPRSVLTFLKVRFYSIETLEEQTTISVELQPVFICWIILKPELSWSMLQFKRPPRNRAKYMIVFENNSPSNNGDSFPEKLPPIIGTLSAMHHYPTNTMVRGWPTVQFPPPISKINFHLYCEDLKWSPMTWSNITWHIHHSHYHSLWLCCSPWTQPWCSHHVVQHHILNPSLSMSLSSTLLLTLNATIRL